MKNSLGNIKCVLLVYYYTHMKSSDAKASKCHFKFSSRMIIFIKLEYLSSVISLKWQWSLPINCHLSEITELKYTSLIYIYIYRYVYILYVCIYVFYAE